ncbi:glutathione-dependent formaldehyde-activating [Stipitochalara longipes BDJ]|nr:glutathione-dependent formaldehyde-activating [Stipitochalara longipes BDJ]
MDTKFPIEGSCACKHIRYRMEATPLIVNCCHCFSCQRKTGSAFALNAVIESSNITTLTNSPEFTPTPTASGLGQQIARCPKCHTALWSHYGGAGPAVAYVRVGTLENPNAVMLDGNVPVVERGSYERGDVWGKESLVRWGRLRPEIERYKVGLVTAEGRST